ncbi:TPA: hypothetical protein ACJ2XP_004876 [Enterobacter cloacae]
MEARQGGDGLPAPFTTAPVPAREVAHRQTQQEEKPTEQLYQPVRHRYGHYWQQQQQQQQQQQRRHYRQNRNIADPLQHTNIHTLAPHEHQALAEMRGAAGAANFAGRQSLPGFSARADRRLNRLPGKISY